MKNIRLLLFLFCLPAMAQTIVFTPLYVIVGDTKLNKIVLPHGAHHKIGTCADSVTLTGSPSTCATGTGTYVQIRQTGNEQRVKVDGKTIIIPAVQHGLSGVRVTNAK